MEMTRNPKKRKRMVALGGTIVDDAGKIGTWESGDPKSFNEEPHAEREKGHKRKKKATEDSNDDASTRKQDNGIEREAGKIKEEENSARTSKRHKKKKKATSANSSCALRRKKESKNKVVDMQDVTEVCRNDLGVNLNGKISKKKKREKNGARDYVGNKVRDRDIGTPSSTEYKDHAAPEEMISSRTKDKYSSKHEIAKRERSLSETVTKKKRKKVSFSDHLEVFPSSDVPHDGNGEKEQQQPPHDGNGEKEQQQLVRGKRFSPEEDEIVKTAVYKYIETHCLGENGLSMVLNCSAHRKVAKCWNEIGAALPYRPVTAIYYRAHVLFRRGDKRKWTQEEYEMIKKFQQEHGNQWKVLADELGKHRFHVKDTWRRIRLANMKYGHWSQDEFQNLFDLVNVDLQMKAFEEKKAKHGMLRDNIPWTAISTKLTTRTEASCCDKWYAQLSSPLVAEGKWADSDDYRLLTELYELDKSCIEDVDWDNLLEHRSGDICLKRWNQMVRHLGPFGLKSFAEQVEVLAKRYCPDLLEAREAWENKPPVP